MATKKDKVEQAKEAVDKKQKEAALDNDITAMPGLGGGSGKGNNASSSTQPTGNKTGTTGGSTGGNKSVSKEQQNVIDAISNFEKELEQERKDTEAYNQRKAEENDFDTKKGRSEYYQSLETIGKEKDRAEDRLNKAIDNNSIIGENKALKAMYQNALKSNKKTGKEAGKILESQQKEYNSKLGELSGKEKELLEKANGLDRTNIEGELAETNSQLEHYLVLAREDLAKNEEGLVGDAWIEKLDELNQREAELTEKRDTLLKQLNDLDSLDAVQGEISDLKEQQKAFTSDNIDVLLEWADKSGTDDDKARAATIRGLRDAIYKADEDGFINDEEKEQLNALIKNCDKLIKEEMESDPDINDAQNAYDSAKAKYSYFLFDQIKAIAVLMIGLSQGNASMIYSALDNFNKSIADAESKYNTDTIAALSSNNIKNITEQSDAEYVVTTEIVPELKKQKAFQDLSAREKEISVRALENAFEEYRRYAKNGGGDDFRAWFTAQTANGNSSGWASVITTLIQAGALNWDAIIKAFGGGTTPQPKTKGGPVSFNLGTQGQTNEAMQNILKSLSDEAVAKSSTPQVTKDKQATVVNSLASKIPQQPSAPQNGPVQARSNSRWNAIG